MSKQPEDFQEHKQKRMEWVVLGRVIGTATGWDQADTMSMTLYDFEPAPGVTLPSGDPCICFEEGVIEYYDGEGDDFKVSHSFDLIDTLKNAERRSLKEEAQA